MSEALKINDKCDAEMMNLIKEFLRFMEVEKGYSSNTLSSYQIDIFYFIDSLFRKNGGIITKKIFFIIIPISVVDYSLYFDSLKLIQYLLR